MKSHHGLFSIDDAAVYDDVEHVSLEYDEDDVSAEHRKEIRKKLDQRLERRRLKLELDDYADLGHDNEDEFDWSHDH